MKPESTERCKRVPCCTGDVSAIGADHKSVLEGLEAGTVRFKNDKIEIQKCVLVSMLQKKAINGAECWTIAGSERHQNLNFKKQQVKRAQGSQDSHACNLCPRA